MQCEMCGKNSELMLAIIEGVNMKVCDGCSKFGKIIGRVSSRQKESKIVNSQTNINQNEETEEELVSDFSLIIRQEREKRRMEQKDFAKLISEKESILHKMESGNFKPTIEAARKIERILKVKLVQEVGEKMMATETHKNSGALTIGDLIKKK